MKNTVALVRLKRIITNAEEVKKRAGAPLIAVVKDDAYGHGAEAVASALHSAVYAFAVSSPQEGAALRIGGTEKEILVLSPPVDFGEALVCAYYGLTVSISSFAVLALVERAAQEYGIRLKAHLAVNTGMNRYGFRPEYVSRALLRAALCADVTGIYSHFYAPQNARAREEQYRLFSGACEAAKKIRPDLLCHLSATGGILAGEKYNFNAVRCGIALYGYLPEGFEGELPVKPAMRIYGAAAQSGKALGGGAGYNMREKHTDYFSTYRFGYGDGFLREGGFGVGKLCMDACVRSGRATFGARRLLLRDAARYAKEHNTTAYEVLVNAGKEAVKVYV